VLYLLPTPIGNLGDVTLRALEILKQVDLILCEDTRITSRLLQQYDIKAKLLPFHTHNEHHKLSQIIDQLRAGADIALVTDAGSPGISDPGYLIARSCIDEGIPFDVLPGATAFVPALIHSGLPAHRFHFEGFLPHKKGRNTRLQYLATLPDTFILYESPLRLLKCLNQLAAHCGPERPAAICRELTKMYQQVQRGTLSSLIQAVNEKTFKTKGEMVIVVHGL